jgi:hypothetical protein
MSRPQGAGGAPGGSRASASSGRAGGTGWRGAGGGRARRPGTGVRDPGVRREARAEAPLLACLTVVVALLALVTAAGPSLLDRWAGDALRSRLAVARQDDREIRHSVDLAPDASVPVPSPAGSRLEGDLRATGAKLLTAARPPLAGMLVHDSTRIEVPRLLHRRPRRPAPARRAALPPFPGHRQEHHGRRRQRLLRPAGRRRRADLAPGDAARPAHPLRGPVAGPGRDRRGGGRRAPAVQPRPGRPPHRAVPRLHPDDARPGDPAGDPRGSAQPPGRGRQLRGGRRRGLLPGRPGLHG